MRLIEPLGLLDGRAAEDAVRAGLALPLAGGPTAFTLARVIEPDGRATPPRPVGDLPATWADMLPRVTVSPPSWAGLPEGPAVMGILNITPDSFSDGGVHEDAARAIAAGQTMTAAGAAILDVGGESTRPGSLPVPPVAERARILPVIRGLADASVPVSVDTRNASTMAAALEAGARIVNDVSGLTHDPDAASIVAASGCPVILMHMRGAPETMMEMASYTDVALDVVRELSGRLAAAEAAGIDRGRICLDPGIGFAKTATQSRHLIARLPLLLNLGCRILLGVSRKSMIGHLAGAELPTQRLPGSLAAALYGLAHGASILRVHDVPETIQALQVWQAMAV